MNGHDVIWTQPPSLLSRAARLIPTPRAAFRSPAILRFTTDAFMEEFLNVLETSPERLAEYRVRRETWRGFTPGPAITPRRVPSRVFQRLGITGPAAAPTPARPQPVAAPAGTPLKLYQPAHQRHYLVACSLVCETAGLPDRAVESGRGEQAGIVVRRLLPPDGAPAPPVAAWDEHAWVSGPNGPVWQRVGANRLVVVDGEERLPLFTVQFAENERRKRRLLAGVIPVGRREAYLGAPKAQAGADAAAAGVTPRTSRKILLRKEVIEPWKALVSRSRSVGRSFTGPFAPGDRAPSDPEKAKRLRLEREHIQTVSWFVLLDFAKYLATYVTPVWRAVLNPALRDELNLSAPEGALLDALTDATLASNLRDTVRRDSELFGAGTELYSSADVPTTLAQALARYGSAPEGIDGELERRLEGVDQPYDRYVAALRERWPSFIFPLADPGLPDSAPLPQPATLGTLTGEEGGAGILDDDPVPNDPLQRLDSLAVLVLRALRDDHAQPAPEPAIPAAAIRPADAFEGWFVIRCVYERPGCVPLHGGVMSDPTEPFQMAGFFDPDAPARPIRIGLPIDTTPGGLRKFDKNTAFVISDTLCGQIRRIRGLTLADLVLSVLPWPFHKDLSVPDGGPCTSGNLSLGMICSLSIPIITLCALILLIIMVTLLDLIFRWLPYFVICFPIPGLRAKRESNA